MEYLLYKLNRQADALECSLITQEEYLISISAYIQTWLEELG